MPDESRYLEERINRQIREFEKKLEENKNDFDKAMDKKISEALLDVGIDITNNTARLDQIQDYIYIRNQRLGRKETQKSVSKLLIEKVVSAAVTFISCIIAAAFSWFISSGVNHR